MSLQKIASAEAAFVASVRQATAAVDGVATVTVDAALAELRAALAAANERMRLAVEELRHLIGTEAGAFADAAVDAAMALDADVAAMTPEPAIEEVRRDLDALGIDTRPAVARVLDAVHNAGKAESEALSCDHAPPTEMCADLAGRLTCDAPPDEYFDRMNDADLTSGGVNRVAVALGAVDANARADLRDDCKASEDASAKAAHADNGRPRGKRRKGQ